MEDDFLLAVANHLAAKATLTPFTWYAGIAFSGAEVAGVTRVPVTLADPELVTTGLVHITNGAPVGFTNTPDGDGDALWIFDDASAGSVAWKLPVTPFTMTDGGAKTWDTGTIIVPLERG